MKLYGLIGYPLGHSFSQKYFTQKFEKEKLDCRFENYPIENIELFPGILETNPSLRGMSVTIPYKLKVISYLHEISPEVEHLNACNSIRISDGKLTGYNTDTIGFEKSLLNKLQPWHTRALILGTGGASKAVEYILKKRGIEYTLVSRSPGDNVITYQDLSKDLVQQSLLIINASPLGTFPEVHTYPQIPYDGIGDQHFLFDLVYNPEKTIFLTKGEERGAVIQNGYDMLINQAEASWEIWNAVEGM
ncbi:MAG: shikimate dehydrogenase [Agriterribacter sp.]